MIPDDIVEEVRERADIVEVVGEHVRLKRAGKDYKALCPFHKEKTPSFYVVPAKGFYNCFGCGASGDAFSFLMEHAGLDFQEAVRHLAARVGVEIPERGARPGPDPHQSLYEAVAFAADFFVRHLREEDDVGAPARAYLERRGITREAAERYRLGYAPAEWRALRDAARRHGFEDEVLFEAGLIKTSERSPEPYDRFRDRLIFPITDARGRVIAFGGRVIDDADDAPKYLNSPETPIYHKGDVLYGLHWAKTAIRRAGSALVVEGYMDYVSLASSGIEHVVAPLGTAMTERQAALLARYTKKALVLYDSDAAGLRATFRTGDALLRTRVHPLVVTLPDGEDPDSLVQSGNAEALAPYLDAAVDVVDRKLQILERRGFFEDIERIRKALDGLLPTIRATADPALRDIYVARVAERTGVRRETIEKELMQMPAPASGPAGGVGPGRAHRPRRRPGPPPEAREPRAPRGVAGQRKLILLLLRDEDRIAHAAESLEPEDFTDPRYRALFEALAGSGGLRGRDPAALGLTEAELRLLETLRGHPEEIHEGGRMFDDLVKKLRAGRMERRIEEIQAQLRTAQEAGDDERVASLTREKMKLKHALLEGGYASTWLISRRARPS